MTNVIKPSLNEAVKASLKNGEKRHVGALRLILAAIKQQEVDTRTAVNDDEILVILAKMAKQRRESISHYEKAKRHDLVAQEQFELDLLESYLPAALSNAEIAAAIDNAITTAGATNRKDMGKVMGILKTSLQGRADMSVVGATVKTRLSP